MQPHCTYSTELNNHSALPEHASTRCGKVATHRFGNPKNQSALYLCDEHAELVRTTDPWGESSVQPLEK